MSKRKRNPIAALFRLISALLLTAVIALIFYLAAIISQPQDAAVSGNDDQPLLAASPSVSISAIEELPDLLQDFPAPVLGYVSGAGPSFAGGTSYDFPFEGGTARTIVLNYVLDDGSAVTVQTIYPARAISTVSRGTYQLTGTRSVSFAGLTAVRMENSSSIRMHAQNENAVYVLTLPKSCGNSLADYTRALHQITLQKDAGQQ